MPSSAPLPLAHAAIRNRTEEAHTRQIPIPTDLRSQPVENVMTAVAGLLYVYTAMHAIKFRVVGPESTYDSMIFLNDHDSLEHLRRHVDEPPTTADLESPVHVQIGHSGYSQTQIAPLMLDVHQEEATLHMNAAEFDDDAVDQYSKHLTGLLNMLVRSPKKLLEDIQVLSPEERRRMTHTWNRTETDVPRDFFHERMAQVANDYPNKVALTSGSKEITFAQLNDESNQLAAYLQSLGIRHGDRVGICFLRCIESIIAQLACFRVGASALLLDPDFPDSRLRFMTADAEAKVVLTVSTHAHKVVDSPSVVCLDDDDWRSSDTSLRPAAVGGSDFIHICYTSGSTGQPKAVKIRHSAARNLIYSMREVRKVDDNSRGAWLAAPGYGMIEVEVFPVLAAGSTVHIPPESIAASPERLHEWMLNLGITHALLMRTMAERMWSLRWPQDAALRNVCVCGERILSWPHKNLPFRLINLYGSAEASVVASCDLTELAEHLGEDGRSRCLPPIGRPIANVKTFVLDEHLRPVAPGVVGELCVTGDSLSAGYLNLPEATAEKWVDNPFDPERHPILYRTGDLARYWSNGNIEIVGRTDSQVKVRGNRVHLGEIEAVLAAQPGVRQAAVLANTDTNGDVWLAAYIDPAPPTATTPGILRRALAARLPSFMVPSVYVIENLPTSANGKVDRAALPHATRSRANLDADFVPPRNELEARMVALWENLLEVSTVGIDDDFFELGGDSLHAARLAELLSAKEGTMIELDDLFAGEATIRGMATSLRKSIAI